MANKKSLVIKPLPFSGCAHDETCRNLAAIQARDDAIAALRVQLAGAESLSEERRIGWVKQSALSAEVAVRLGDVTRERDAALAQLAEFRTMLEEARSTGLL